MGMPRFQPQTGNGLQNPRQVEVAATAPPTIACNRSQSLCQGKEPMKSYNPLPSSTRASKNPLPGGGGASERASSTAHSNCLCSLMCSKLAPSGTSPGNVLAPCLIARLNPEALCRPPTEPSSAERGKSSFHYFFKTVDPHIQPVSPASHH
jgi:hypothetical protein